MRKLFGSLRRLKRDDRGAMAVLLALSLVPLTFAAIGAVDLTNGLNARSRLQDALDAATLAAARSDAADDAGVAAVGTAELVRDYGPAATGGGANGVSATFQLQLDGTKVVANADQTVPTMLYRFISGGRDLHIGAHSEVVRSSANVEVSLVLDITGSMGQPSTKIESLKAAATELVNLVVQDRQTPFYSKAAIIPYSNSVNAGQYADYVRGDCSGACATLTYKNPAGETRQANITTCVTERIGDYTDASPLGKPVGKKYGTPDSPCVGATVTPLTTDKSTLRTKIANLSVGGSTAGQIGLAWGWYAVSPNFAGALPIESRPGPYSTKKTPPAQKIIKAVVLMTDGEFNTAYYSGVVSNEEVSGNLGGSWKINHAADNGTPFEQAAKLCDNIKKEDVYLYTVGFQLVEPAAQKLMKDCATNAESAYLPNSGTDLKAAFHAIAADINALRISK